MQTATIESPKKINRTFDYRVDGALLRVTQVRGDVADVPDLKAAIEKLADKHHCDRALVSL